jgi:hypothetical protein
LWKVFLFIDFFLLFDFFIIQMPNSEFPISYEAKNIHSLDL